MRCVNHVQSEAIGTCEYCGRPYCKECLAEIRGKYYCREHVAYALGGQPHYAAPYTPQTTVVNNYINPAYDYYPYKSRLAAVILCLPPFGILGAHRFYTGKIGTGLIWFFTGGFFLLGWLLDLLLIILGLFRDKAGRPLV
ncbi:MAG: TM2 domain-containing protein [Clostridiales bacterium]|nr:TM2 domain-containing protein [Clostridiales bacterium]